MFEHYIITDHVVDRYRERVNESCENVKRRIKNDLYFKKIRQIITKGDVKHVFTLNSKEFIFVKERGRWLLKTIIKRTRQRTEYAIQQRKRAVVA